MFDLEKVGRFDFNPHDGECGMELVTDGDYVLASDYDQLLAMYNQFKIAKPISEWHEDIGPCLWWAFPISEPPYSGTPNDCDWPEYHTHFTRLTNDMLPENGQEEQ